MGEAAPQLKMNVLKQVAASFRVGFIGAREPLEQWTVSLGHFTVHMVLSYRGDSLGPSHNQGCRSK
jgi:hypothetical protein